MSLVVLGINQRTAPLDLLERITVPSSRLEKALTDLQGRPYISESVVLSTCNRTEVYVHAEKFHGAYQDVRDFLAQFSGLAPEEFADHLYVFYDDEAVQHLFGVCSGLDSAVVGEHEIQGQVKTAWAAAQGEGSVGPTLNSAFRHAIEVGKRVRTETAIGRGIASVSHAAVVLAEERLETLVGKNAFVLGAGDMGGGMAGHFGDAGLGELVVASRTWDKASGLAERFGGRAVHLDELERELLAADVLFTSTSASSYMLEYDQLVGLSEQRAGRPLLIIDIAMPRDVDPAANDLAGITLLDMDAVRKLTEAGLRERSGEIGRVRSIIDLEVGRFSDESSARELAPLISAFRSQAESIRRAELDRFSSQLADLTDDQAAAVEKMTAGLLGKLLHEPTVRLKDASDTSRGDRLAAALRDLYDLP